jgi:hypothetical protein
VQAEMKMQFFGSLGKSTILKLIYFVIPYEKIKIRYNRASAYLYRGLERDSETKESSTEVKA